LKIQFVEDELLIFAEERFCNTCWCNRWKHQWRNAPHTTLYRIVIRITTRSDFVTIKIRKFESRIERFFIYFFNFIRAVFVTQFAWTWQIGVVCHNNVVSLLQIWHKQCFKCQGCGMTLNMRTYKGFNKQPYCEA